MSSSNRSAILYRMVLPDHVCPFGVAANELLQEAGYEVDDRLLQTREEVDAFKEEHGVDTTPQIFIAGAAVGGCDELRDYLEAHASS